MYTLDDYRKIFSEWDPEIWATEEPRTVILDKATTKDLKNQIDKMAKSLGFRRTSDDGKHLTYTSIPSNAPNHGK